MRTGGDLYSDSELINLAKMPRRYLKYKIKRMSTTEAFQWINRLERSLTEFSKRNKHLINIQTDIAVICRDVERVMWFRIYTPKYNEIYEKNKGLLGLMGYVKYKKFCKNQTLAIVEKELKLIHY